MFNCKSSNFLCLKVYFAVWNAVNLINQSIIGAMLMLSGFPPHFGTRLQDCAPIQRQEHHWGPALSYSNQVWLSVGIPVHPNCVGWGYWGQGSAKKTGHCHVDTGNGQTGARFLLSGSSSGLSSFKLYTWH